MNSSSLLIRSSPQFSNLFFPKPDNPIQFIAASSRPTLCFVLNSTISPPSPASSQPPAPAAGTRTTVDLRLKHLSRNGMLQEAVGVLESCTTVDASTYVSLLQSCIDSDSIALGRRLHAKIGSVRDPNPFVETKLVSMYAKCGSLEEARQMFNGMRVRNLFTWSAIIGGCAREQRWEDVIELFYRMMAEGTTPDVFLFPKILQACANAEDKGTGTLLHSLAVRCGFVDLLGEGHVSNSILAMYAKCGELSTARRFFEKMGRRDPVSWNSMISGHCQHGEIEEALVLFERMQADGFAPSLVTWNILITSYNYLGDPDRAMEMMKKMQCCGLVPDVFTWTSMISGLAQNNRTLQALELFREMHLAAEEPNGMTFAGGLSACASLKALGKGKELHSLSLKLGYSCAVLVGNSLIDMYAKCGRLEDAERVFYQMPKRDVFTWNSMIGGYTQSGYSGKACDLFSKMENSGVQQNIVTWNIMVSGYMQNGDEDRAMDLFRRMETDGVGHNTASWNLLIAGSLQNGNRNGALRVFRQMQSLSVKPNSVTILSILPACASLTSSQKVKEIHACVLHNGFQSELSISNSLVDTYAKSGDICSARSLFDHLSFRDTITWNSLISGYVLHRLPKIALDIFHRMKQEEAKPNQATFACILCAYGILSMVTEGKELFSSLVESYGISPALEHYTALVELLGRSGRLKEALEFVEKMPIQPDFSVWYALLTACRIHGNKQIGKFALEQLLELEPRNSVIQNLSLQMQALCSRCNGVPKLTKLHKGWKSDGNMSCCWMGHPNRVLSFSTGDKSIPNSKSIYGKLDAMTEEIKAAKTDMFHSKHLEIEEEGLEVVTGIHSEKLAIALALINDPDCKSIKIVKNLRMCHNCHTIAKYVSTVHQCEIMLKDPTSLHHFKDGQCSCGDYW